MEDVQRLWVLDKQVHEAIVDGRAQVALESLLLLLGRRLVEPIQVDVAGGVGFHVGRGRREWEGMRLGLLSKLVESDK